MTNKKTDESNDLISIDDFRETFKEYSEEDQDRVLDLFVNFGAKPIYQEEVEEEI